MSALKAHYASDAWLYGPKLPFTFCREERFSWGGIELQLEVNEGIIRAAKVYTDAMDESLTEQIETALTGIRFQQDFVDLALQGVPHGTEIGSLLR